MANTITPKHVTTRNANVCFLPKLSDLAMSVYSVLRVWITKCHSLEMLLIHTGTGMLKIALSRILGIRLLSIKDLINIGSVSVMGYWIWKRI